MAIVTSRSDLGAQKNKICHCFHFFPIYLPWSDKTRCHDLNFFDVEFQASFFHSPLSPSSRGSLVHFLLLEWYHLHIWGCWYFFQQSWFHLVIHQVQFRFHSCVWLFVTPWTAAHQASLSITNSQSLLKLMSIESVMPSNHLILCRPLLLPPSIFPSIRVFSSEFFASGGQNTGVQL